MHRRRTIRWALALVAVLLLGARRGLADGLAAVERHSGRAAGFDDDAGDA